MTKLAGIVRIILRVVFGLLFLAAGSAKLFGAPMMVQEFALFQKFGIGQWFRYLTGVIEIVGAVMLIRPRWVSAGAGLLACVCLGAFAAQLAVIHQDAIHALVFAGLLGWLGWSQMSAGKA